MHSAIINLRSSAGYICDHRFHLELFVFSLNSLLVGLGFDTSLMMRSIPLRGFDQVSTFIIGSKPLCIKDERYQTVSARSP